jgi:alpha-aminoadipic semialdehyde synthase
MVNINTEDCMEPLDATATYNRADFYANPQKYSCNFATKFLPYISALFQCIYWNPGYPRYISNKELHTLHSEQKLPLIGICDVRTKQCR